MGKNSGFTLIELAAVILIAGLFAWLGLSSLRDSPPTQIQAAARGILSTAESCRVGATLAGRARSIVYDLDAQEWWVEIPPEQEGSLDASEKILESTPPKGVRLEAVLVDEKTTATEGQVRLTATASGFLPAHLVRLRHAEGALLATAAIGPFAGQARVVEGHPDWTEAFVTEVEEDVAGGVEPEPVQ